jgi:hypothetical protein
MAVVLILVALVVLTFAVALVCLAITNKKDKPTVSLLTDEELRQEQIDNADRMYDVIADGIVFSLVTALSHMYSEFIAPVNFSDIHTPSRARLVEDDIFVYGYYAKIKPKSDIDLDEVRRYLSEELKRRCFAREEIYGLPDRLVDIKGMKRPALTVFRLENKGHYILIEFVETSVETLNYIRFYNGTKSNDEFKGVNANDEEY